MQNEVKPQMQVQQASDGEGAMARADLYRAAKNAMKLFQMVQEGQELEGWVQAKITKSADYLDSVYHYMEYQMKFGGGGQAASVDDITGEAEIVSANTVSEEDDEKPIDMEESMNYEQRLKALLEGAKQKAMMLKKKPAKKDEKVEEGKTEVQYDKAGKRTGVKHTSTHKYSDEPHTEPKSQAKGKSAAEKVGDKAADKQQEKDSKDYAKKNPGSVTRYKDGKKVSEASTGKKFDALKHVKNPTKGEKTAAKDVKRGSYGDRAALLKSAEADGRVKEAVFVKPGAREKMAADKAAKDKEEQNRVRTPVNLKKEPVKEASKPDFLDMDDDNDKKEPMKKAIADKKAGPKKGVNPFAKKNEGIVSAVKSAVGMGAKKPLTTAEKNAAAHAANKGKNMPSSGNAADDYDYFTGRDKVLGGEKKKESVKESVTESADLTRMKQFLTRLNG